MIAKIMKSASSFDAVYYNENKVKEQKAEFLTAVNFNTVGTNLNFLTRNEYIAYFNKISDLNTRVKNKQFHAVLSTKGQEHGAEELKAIGEAYIKRMGYGDNPYLIYFHQDTDNNHVHIVSTRVDKQGEKVDDSFEKKRSLATIQTIMQQSERKDWTAKNLIDDVLQYNFSTEGQLKTLLELRGYETREGEEREMQIWKDNRFIAAIDRDTVLEKLKTPRNEQRLKQIRAIVLKYKEGRGEVELKAFFKEKFGLDLVFHRGNKSDKPFGYTVVDNANMQVFKGSEVLKMSNLLQNTEGGSHQKKVEQILEKKDPNVLQDYMNDNDLLFMQNDNRLYLIDRQNDEVFEMSDSKHKISRDFIFDFGENKDISKEKDISLDLFIGTGGAGDVETDRKKKRGMKR